MLKFSLALCCSILVLSQQSGFGEAFTHMGKEFRVHRAKPEEVRLVWQGANGKPLSSFQAAYRKLAKEGKTVAMLTNGGIYEPGRIPSGLYVERGKTLKALNLKSAEGNFFLKPNAVFYILTDGEEADRGRCGK